MEFKLFINSFGLKVPRFRGTPISCSSYLKSFLFVKEETVEILTLVEIIF